VATLSAVTLSKPSLLISTLLLALCGLTGLSAASNACAQGQSSRGNGGGNGSSTSGGMAGIGGMGAGSARPSSVPQTSSDTNPGSSPAPAVPRVETMRSPAAVSTTGGNVSPGAGAAPSSIRAPMPAAPRPAEARPPEREQRAQAVEQLLRSNPGRVERDPLGEAVLSGEIMVLLPEQARLPSELLARGFSVLRQTEVLGRSMVVLRVPATLALPAAIELAQQLLPGAEVDFNHLHLGSGLGGPGLLRAAGAVSAAAEAGAALRIGLIDEALRPGPELRDMPITSRACAGAPPPEGHGTAVATVLRRSALGLGRQIRLHAADMSCGHGAVDAIAGALNWMDAELIPVVNISMVGPHNRVLAAVVASFLGKGHLLVAAVGNDGPAAPPLYPAAYPGVVGVTAVDEQGQVLIEAGRGEHVAFAALGIADIDTGTGRPRRWRGTSFAAPIVTAALAARLPAPDRRSAAEAVTSLARSACDLGEPGRDRIYGHGLVGGGPNQTLAVAH